MARQSNISNVAALGIYLEVQAVSKDFDLLLARSCLVRYHRYAVISRKAGDIAGCLLRRCNICCRCDRALGLGEILLEIIPANHQHKKNRDHRRDYQVLLPIHLIECRLLVEYEWLSPGPDQCRPYARRGIL